MLLTASIILVLCGVTHSYLGERYILIRLFKRDNIPHLFGSDFFTKGTLRFCWHITSIAWFGIALILANGAQNIALTLYIISAVFLLSGLCSAFFTKGKHLSWLAFFVVSLLVFIQATNS